MAKCKKINETIECYYFKNLVRQISPIKDLFALWEIKKYIEKEKPDYIHLNSSKTGILGSFAVKLAKYKPKVWYTVHGWVFLEPMAKWRKKLYIFLERWASKYRDKIIVLGEREKQIALKYKICSEEKLETKKHIIWGLGLPLLNKERSRETLNLPQNKKIIGNISNLFPTKGLNYLISSASQIDNPDILFAIIGDGPELNNLKEQINNLKLQDKVVLLGEKEYAAQYLNAFDIFILPSIKEGAPYTILEAMHANLPIIATDVGAIPEMLENYNNKTIIPHANIYMLTQAILKKI